MPGNNAFILSELLDHSGELRRLVREDPDFGRRIYDALERLACEGSDASATRAVDDLIAVLLESPLAPVARNILRLGREREQQRFSPGSIQEFPADPGLAAALANRLANAIAPYQSAPPAAAAAPELPEEMPAGETMEAPPPGEGELHINAWIGERLENPTEPLEIGHIYSFNCNVGRANPATLLRPEDARMPEADILPEGLLTEWLIVSPYLELASPSPEIFVEHKTTEEGELWTAKFNLLVKRGQDSEVRMLWITPRKYGETEIEILVLAASQIYRRLSIALTACSGGTPESAEPAFQFRSDQCLTPAAHLNLRTTHEWTTPPGELTIQVLPVGLAAVYGDVAGESIGTSVPWAASPPAMAGKMQNVRLAADRTRAKFESYLNDVDPVDMDRLLSRLPAEGRWPYNWDALPDFVDAAHKQLWSAVETSAELRELAVYGHQLYDAVFPPGTELRGWMDRLKPGHRVNIVWQLAGVSDVPWGLMYLPEPPDPGDPVDATGFLALRLRIEYRAFPVSGGAKNLGDLQHAARAFFFYWGNQTADPVAKEAQWQRSQWGTLMNHLLVPTSPAQGKQEILDFFKTKQTLPVTLLYMFCHCNVGEGNSPVLRFGNTNASADVIKGTDLTRRLPDQPLVFVNACTSSAADPNRVNDLEWYFFNSGCRGYLGTESKVPVEFASRFAAVFFAFLFRLLDSEPMAAGEAVAQTRLFFWTHYRNIGGLFYSYLNQYELYMAEDAEIRALRR